MGAPETRRARQRRELVAEVLAIARRQLEAGGRAGVSLRAIAREIKMNPTSLYTYFASLDELFTALLLESYQSLVGAVREAHQSSADSARVDRVLAFAVAYRNWAKTHPAQFNLIFTDQLPGYEAPAASGTREAEVELLHLFGQAIGKPVGDPYDNESTSVPSRALQQRIGVFGLLHGLVSLEINNHVPIFDDWEGFIRSQLRHALAHLT